MKRLIPIVIIAFFLSFEAFAAPKEAALRFENEIFDFGTLTEEGGIKSHVFLFENISDEPIVILRVSTSCGCTTAEYSQRPIGPKGRGEIKAIFNPMNQPGDFARRLSVYTSDGNITHLTVKGSVTPRVRSAAERHAIDLGGGLKIDTNAHAFGYIEHGAAARSTFSIYNDSDRTITISVTPTDQSSTLDIRYPHTLAPHAEAEIDFGYMLDAASSLYGTLRDVLSVEVNGKTGKSPLVISAIAIDPRDKFDENEPPKAQLSENFIKFGVLNNTSRTVSHRITISNNGLSPLRIRKIESENGLTEGVVDKSSIDSDKEATLTVTLKTEGAMPGAITDRLRIVTNDPQSPVRTIKVTAIIER